MSELAKDIFTHKELEYPEKPELIISPSMINYFYT